jgi:EAL and modified HD-GYP domain-containing signal transduction protein
MTPGMHRYIARQPILDAKLNVVGYELLFRRAAADEAAEVVDDDASTSETMLASLSDIGLDSLVGGRHAFMNVPRAFLLDGHVQLCPPERVTLELLESLVVDDEMVGAVEACATAGYRLALDDFAYRPELEPVLRLASIVKLDVLALGVDGVAEQIERVKPFGVTLLAEKVESHAVYRACRELGCELFQGYFFSRPATVGARTIPASRVSRMRLIASLQDPSIQPDELAAIIRGDAGLSLRLLRYVNSAFVGLPRTVGSIQEALVLCGYRKLRSLATLIAFASVSESPPELLV